MTRLSTVAHVVVTDNFAGAERYVCNVANETATRGWDAAVVGGNAERMRLALTEDVRWLPGANPLQALASLARLGRRGVCHAHMTMAEALALTAQPFHRAPVLATRHFAAARGRTRVGTLVAPWISRRLTREVAISEFVGRAIERPPDAVVPNGVPSMPLLWKPASRVVLVLQRLEAEKNTLTALRAWNASGLADDGWSLRVVGDGSERESLQHWAVEHDVRAVTFVGWTPDVDGELAAAGLLLAPAPAEPFGLAVVEAMAAGVPVVAAAAGGHLETVGLVGDAALFAPGDHEAAAKALRTFTRDDARAAASTAGREIAASRFSLAAHVDALLVQYELAQAGRRGAG